jgi:ABC-2 type transport system ATP-binding protein
MQDLLLAEKARGRTLLLSTHQMNPVERLCDRLLMLRRGQVMLYGPMAEIRARYRTGGVRVEHEGPLPEIAGVTAEAVATGVTRLRPPDGMPPNALLRRLVENDAVLQGFAIETPALEDIFRRVVGEEEADAG